ncbi:patatin-like phospholipase family protein [Rivibacter subsaxonicus]|uniref:NTE family protein n=1 Tax=Rivibacter subsaxonicus TaxID=457575 RepID=A0A4Q7VAG6_9BURK|nr:patatin-like phospholipase family protein [Rivibacter subsaxonicus]RZT93751.1 NTE family protein [Rivibacter subsaxonicus]
MPRPIDIDESRRRLLSLAGLTALLSGCAAFDYREPDAPGALTQLQPMQPKPQVALVLGSGGPRGYAHIGVLRVLEEAGIEPDLVVGSSVGALIGVFWASGLDAEQIDERSMQGGPLTLFDPNPFADRGWIRGQKLQDYVNDSLGGRRLEDLPRRVIVVATRRDDKQPRFFANGNPGVAVRASGAMPGIISPVGIDGVEYEDADESLPVAVSVARSAGAGFVIAVDVSARAGSTPADAPASMRLRDQRRRARIEPEVARADFLIHPDLPYWAGPRRSYFIESRAAGEATARERLPALRARVASAQ